LSFAAIKKHKFFNSFKFGSLNIAQIGHIGKVKKPLKRISATHFKSGHPKLKLCETVLQFTT
jgi:hypothetical protein